MKITVEDLMNPFGIAEAAVSRNLALVERLHKNVGDENTRFSGCGEGA